MQKRLRRSYWLPPDVVNLIDQVHLIDEDIKSDIVADSFRIVCHIRIMLPDLLKMIKEKSDGDLRPPFL